MKKIQIYGCCWEERKAELEKILRKAGFSSKTIEFPLGDKQEKTRSPFICIQENERCTLRLLSSLEASGFHSAVEVLLGNDLEDPIFLTEDDISSGQWREDFKVVNSESNYLIGERELYYIISMISLSLSFPFILEIKLKKYGHEFLRFSRIKRKKWHQEVSLKKVKSFIIGGATLSYVPSSNPSSSESIRLEVV